MEEKEEQRQSEAERGRETPVVDEALHAVGSGETAHVAVSRHFLRPRVRRLPAARPGQLVARRGAVPRAAAPSMAQVLSPLCPHHLREARARSRVAAGRACARDHGRRGAPSS